MPSKTSVGFTMTGLKEALGKIEGIADKKKTESRLRYSMRKAAEPILAFAKQKVAVSRLPGGGTLKRSLIIRAKKLRNGNLSVRVGPDSDVVEMRQTTTGDIDSGSFSLRIFGRKKRPSRYAHLVEYGSRHNRRKPFIRPAGARHGGNIYIGRVASQLGKAYDRLARKGARLDAR